MPPPITSAFWVVSTTIGSSGALSRGPPDHAPHQADGLGRGALVVVGVGPRALLADVGLVVLVGVEAGPLRYAAECHDVELGRAGGDDEAVEVLRHDVGFHLGLAGVGAGEDGRLCDDDPRLVLDGVDHGSTST